MALLEGTTVWLKTGGPAMSIKFKTMNDTYQCSWFEGKNIKEHDFAEGQLTTEDPNANSISFSSNPKRNNRY